MSDNYITRSFKAITSLTAACLLVGPLGASPLLAEAGPLTAEQLLKEAYGKATETHLVRSEHVEKLQKLKADMKVVTYTSNRSDFGRTNRTDVTIRNKDKVLRHSVIIQNNAGKFRIFTDQKTALCVPNPSNDEGTYQPSSPFDLPCHYNDLSETPQQAAGSSAYEVTQIFDFDKDTPAAILRSHPKSVRYSITKDTHLIIAVVVYDAEGKIRQEVKYDKVEIDPSAPPGFMQIPSDYKILFPKDASEFTRFLARLEGRKKKTT